MIRPSRGVLLFFVCARKIRLFFSLINIGVFYRKRREVSTFNWSEANPEYLSGKAPHQSELFAFFPVI